MSGPKRLSIGEWVTSIPRYEDPPRPAAHHEHLSYSASDSEVSNTSALPHQHEGSDGTPFSPTNALPNGQHFHLGARVVVGNPESLVSIDLTYPIHTQDVKPARANRFQYTVKRKYSHIQWLVRHLGAEITLLPPPLNQGFSLPDVETQRVGLESCLNILANDRRFTDQQSLYIVLREVRVDVRWMDWLASVDGSRSNAVPPPLLFDASHGSSTSSNESRGRRSKSGRHVIYRPVNSADELSDDLVSPGGSLAQRREYAPPHSSRSRSRIETSTMQMQESHLAAPRGEGVGRGDTRPRLLRSDVESYDDESFPHSNSNSNSNNADLGEPSGTSFRPYTVIREAQDGPRGGGQAGNAFGGPPLTERYHAHPPPDSFPAPTTHARKGHSHSTKMVGHSDAPKPSYDSRPHDPPSSSSSAPPRVPPPSKLPVPVRSMDAHLSSSQKSNQAQPYSFWVPLNNKESDASKPRSDLSAPLEDHLPSSLRHKLEPTGMPHYCDSDPPSPQRGHSIKRTQSLPTKGKGTHTSHQFHPDNGAPDPSPPLGRHYADAEYHDQNRDDGFPRYHSSSPHSNRYGSHNAGQNNGFFPLHADPALPSHSLRGTAPPRGNEERGYDHPSFTHYIPTANNHHHHHLDSMSAGNSSSVGTRHSANPAPPQGRSSAPGYGPGPSSSKHMDTLSSGTHVKSHGFDNRESAPLTKMSGDHPKPPLVIRHEHSYSSKDLLVSPHPLVAPKTSPHPLGTQSAPPGTPPPNVIAYHEPVSEWAKSLRQPVSHRPVPTLRVSRDVHQQMSFGGNSEWVELPLADDS